MLYVCYFPVSMPTLLPSSVWWSSFWKDEPVLTVLSYLPVHAEQLSAPMQGTVGDTPRPSLCFSCWLFVLRYHSVFMFVILICIHASTANTLYTSWQRTEAHINNPALTTSPAEQLSRQWENVSYTVFSPKCSPFGMLKASNTFFLLIWQSQFCIEVVCSIVCSRNFIISHIGILCIWTSQYHSI